MASSQPEEPREVKTTRIPRRAFTRRTLTLKKKAMELSKLCNIPVCVISYGPDGNVETWPESREDVEATIDKYRNSDGAFNFSLGSLRSKTYKKHERRGEGLDSETDEKKTKNVEEFEKALATWEGWLDEQHEEETLLSFWTFLESKNRALNERIELLKKKETRI